MRLLSLHIKNFRSFGLSGKTILFPTPHAALVGKNNSGKSNVIKALTILLSSKSPYYHTFAEEDYFDISQPIEMSVTIGDFLDADKPHLMSLPNLTQAQKGALNAKIADGSANVTITLKKHSEEVGSSEEGEENQNVDSFEIKLWGFQVHRKKDDVRKHLITIMTAPPLRDHEDHLTASRWTDYGQLMKEVLETSPQYADIKSLLVSLNDKIKDAFKSQKTSLLKGTQVVSTVEDIEFLLTKGNHPAELLRNLEIFIKENSKYFSIDDVGTGTQSAIIIAMLELALKHKFSTKKLFCIEEPECFIHPHGIRYLGSLIRNICDDNSMQILVSTHSLSLLPSFSPEEIIRVIKTNGETDIKQGTSITSTHFKRFINQNTAEIFFSDRLIFVEGPTEKILLSELGKSVKQTPSIATSSDCNFDRINVGVIEMDSKNSLLNYVTIAEAFEIPYVVMVDRDFLNDPFCRKVCTKLSVTYQTTNTFQLISDLKDKNIIVNSHGEIEDLFNDNDIAIISGKTVADVARIKTAHAPKTSKAFKEIFGGMGKVEYSIKIAEYYTVHPASNPLSDLIRNLYKNNISAISI